MPPLVLGIDLGGTKISTGLVDGDGRIVARDYRPTGAADGPEAVIARMVESARRVLQQAAVMHSQVAAVGIGSPGPLDRETGTVFSSPNLPGWEEVPLRRRIADALGVAAFLENDANAAALAEHRFGAGRGVDEMVYVTASTGIGGGLVLGGRLYRGGNGLAGEIGHITVLPNGPLCGCGNRGCLEAVASGTAIARQGRELLARGIATALGDLCDGDPARVTARMVAEAAAGGDAEAQRILAAAWDYLGIGLATLVVLLGPQRIVVGGGLTNIPGFFEAVRRATVRRVLPPAAATVQIVPARLGEHAGLLGAAAVALDGLGVNPGG